MYKYRNIEKEKYTKKNEHFSMRYGEFFPSCKNSVDNKSTHRDAKMNQEIYPHIMTPIDTKFWIFENTEFWTSKILRNR